MLSERDNQLHHVPCNFLGIFIILYNTSALEQFSCSFGNFCSMFRFDFDIDDPIDDPDTGVVQLRTNQQENADEDQFLPEAQFREISIDDLVRLLCPMIV